MENTVDIYNLLPEEINEVIRKLTTALEIVKCRKNTNSKFVDKEKEIIICPHCQSKELLRMDMIKIRFKLIIVRIVLKNLVHVLTHHLHV